MPVSLILFKSWIVTKQRPKGQEFRVSKLKGHKK